MDEHFEHLKYLIKNGVNAVMPQSLTMFGSCEELNGMKPIPRAVTVCQE